MRLICLTVVLAASVQALVTPVTINTSIKQVKRTGRGYRNAANYRARILLACAARTAA